ALLVAHQGRAVTVRHLDLEPDRQPGGDRRPAVDHDVLSEEDHLPTGAPPGVHARWRANAPRRRAAYDRVSSPRRSSRARPIFTPPPAISCSRTRSASSPRAPAACDTARACNAM